MDLTVNEELDLIKNFRKMRKNFIKKTDLSETDKKIRTIEAKSLKQIKLMKEALRFYADEKHITDMEIENGSIARKALTECGFIKRSNNESSSI